LPKGSLRKISFWNYKTKKNNNLAQIVIYCFAPGITETHVSNNIIFESSMKIYIAS